MVSNWKTVWSAPSELAPYERSVRVRTDGPYQTDGSNFHQQKNDALNYTVIFMLVIGTGGVRVNPKFSN